MEENKELILYNDETVEPEILSLKDDKDDKEKISSAIGQKAKGKRGGNPENAYAEILLDSVIELQSSSMDDKFRLDLLLKYLKQRGILAGYEDTVKRIVIESKIPNLPRKDILTK